MKIQHIYRICNKRTKQIVHSTLQWLSQSIQQAIYGSVHKTEKNNLFKASFRQSLPTNICQTATSYTCLLLLNNNSCIWLYNHCCLECFDTVGWAAGGASGLHKNMGDDGGGHCLVRMEWRPARWSVCLPLLIFPCTIKSRSSLLAPAHPDGRRKRAVKWLRVCDYIIMHNNNNHRKKCCVQKKRLHLRFA